MKNSITETQIDNITNALADIIAENGIVLGDDLKCELNDALSTFLYERCSVEVTQDS